MFFPLERGRDRVAAGRQTNREQASAQQRGGAFEENRHGGAESTRPATGRRRRRPARCGAIAPQWRSSSRRKPSRAEMRSAVDTRWGPSASTISSSEIIELCAAMLIAATTSRSWLRTGAEIVYRLEASSSSLTAKPAVRTSSSSSYRAFLLVIVLGPRLVSFIAVNASRCSGSGRYASSSLPIAVQ